MDAIPFDFENPLVVYTLSDASGQTAEMVSKAAMSQFQDAPLKLVRLPRVVGTEHLQNLLRLIGRGPSLIAYTFVREDLRDTLQTACASLGLPSVDLLSALITEIATQVQRAPRYEAGAMHQKDAGYFKRMDAIDFAIKYDDGKSPHGLLQADLVLVGVSRTSKTPTCLYLAQNQGIKTANVPLVPGHEPPAVLFRMAPGTVIGLTVKPEFLTGIRTSRLGALGLPPESAYADRAKIVEELTFAEQIFRRLRCPVVDVTHKAIEETASEILALTRPQELLI
jgi:regulator of PEP synthase PpsR (kinase-PPPase family)